MKVAKRVVAALSAAAAVVVLILALDRWGGQMAFGVVAAAMTALALLAQAEFYILHGKIHKNLMLFFQHLD